MPGHQIDRLLRRDRERLSPRARAPLAVVTRIGDPEDDAVVGHHRHRVEAVRGGQPGAHGLRPRPVHPRAERRVQHDPPVPHLVAEPLHDQGRVAGHVAGRLALIGQVPPEVGGGVGVEAGGVQARGDLRLRPGRHLAQEPAERAAEFSGAALVVAQPERQPAGPAGRGRDEDAVVGDLLDAPAGGPEREDVTDPRFVDHLLVQLADAGGLLPHHEHAEQAAVRDGAAGGDGQSLGAGAAGEGAGVAVPHQAWLELGEVRGRVLAGEHVEGGLERGPRQTGVRGGAPDGREPLLHVDRLECARGHGLLRQHVERVGDHREFLDRAGEHPLHRDRAVHEVSAVLGVDDGPRHLADLVSRAPHALQPRGHRRRGLDLHDQIHRAHVDAQLERGGRHHRAEPAGLERVLDDRPAFLGHRPVVGHGQFRRRPARDL